MLDSFFKTIERITPTKWRWVLNHDGFKRYFANTGWMFLGQMFSLLVSFFIGAWIARYLGPENYGIISYVIAFVGIFSFIAGLGVDGILNRELVAHPEQRDELLGTAFRLKIIGGTIAFLITIIAAFIFESSAFVRSLIILYSLIFIVQAINVIYTFFSANVLSKKNVRAALIATIASSILKIFFIISGVGITWLVAIYLLDVVWNHIGYMLAYKKYNLKIKDWKFNKELSKKIISNSWFLMISSASVFILMKVDQVMINYFMDERSVGYYSAAVKFVEIWYFVPAVICSSLFPAIVNAKNTNYLLFKKRLRALYILMFVIAVSVAIPSTILAPWAINILFGREYLASVPILQIYIWSGVGLFIGWVINQYLLSENKTKIIMFYNLFSMILNILLNLILIPKIGLNGAAWATLISYSIAPFLVLVFNKQFNILIKRYEKN